MFAFIYRTSRRPRPGGGSDASPQTPSPRRARPRATPSRIERRSMIVRRPLKAAARPAIGRATSSSANAHGLSSSCMSVSHGYPRRAAHRENRRRNHLSDACGVRSHRSSSAKIDHFRQRHRLRPAGLLRTMATSPSFCDAYASWQKGGVENANGRLRRWLPRHLDIDRTSDQDIQEIVLTTNLTPRKCLGFKTPFQALIASLERTFKSASLNRVALRSGMKTHLPRPQSAPSPSVH